MITSGWESLGFCLCLVMTFALFHQGHRLTLSEVEGYGIMCH